MELTEPLEGLLPEIHRFDIERRCPMEGYFPILAAVPGFFLNSLFVILFSRVVRPTFGIEHPTSMPMMIALFSSSLSGARILHGTAGPS